MRSSNNTLSFFKTLLILIILSLLGTGELKAQPNPPRPIKIDPTAQTLSFGAFYQGAAGGTVIIDPSGTRSATGNVFLVSLGYSFSAALFKVHAIPGTIISIMNGPDIALAGVPSGTMTLHIGSSNPSSPFVNNMPYGLGISLYIGGTLTVGAPASNPPGSYTGTYYITLVQE
jgi:1-acyl-sn-glycerol-3-phosphate acyltransferase